MASLAEKYRPRIFEDVIEQESVVAMLRRQVRAGTGKSVILGGPGGVGKTSLLRIYPQALQCEDVSKSGSPCLNCDQCVAFAQPGGHPSCTELDCARSGRFEDVEEILATLRFNPIFGRWRILALDETQQASRRALDALNKQLDELPSWAVFIFATTDVDKLPPPIKSRCAMYELKPISFEAGLLHLKQLCELESIPYELDGLSLIAEVSRGDLRDMITRLDQVSEGGGVVTEQEVRRLFNLDYVDTLVRYMRAVLAADLQAQVNIVDQWSDLASNKAEAIQAFLVFLFTTEVLRFYRPDRLMSSMRPDDREWIVAKTRDRANGAGMDQRKFWQEVVDFWNPDGGGMTDAALCAKLIKFDALMNIGIVPFVAESRNDP